jgi:hypothetical protein
MVEYALILFLFSNNGYLKQTTSVNLGFKTEKFCEEAGKQTVSEFKNFGFKGGKFVCVRTK